MVLPQTNILVYRGRAWGGMDFKVINSDWAGVLGVARYPVDRRSPDRQGEWGDNIEDTART